MLNYAIIKILMQYIICDNGGEINYNLRPCIYFCPEINCYRTRLFWGEFYNCRQLNFHFSP